MYESFLNARTILTIHSDILKVDQDKLVSFDIFLKSYKV